MISFKIIRRFLNVKYDNYILKVIVKKIINKICRCWSFFCATNFYYKNNVTLLSIEIRNENDK